MLLLLHHHHSPQLHQLPLVLLLLLLHLSTPSGLTVTIGLEGQGSRANGSFIQLAPSSVGLWCQSQPSWDLCKWYRPGFSQPAPDSDSCTCYCKSSTSPCDCSCPSTSLSPWKISRSSSGNCLLSLSGLDARDSGWWRCALTPRNSGGTNDTFGEVMLHREGMVEPEIVLSPGQVDLVEGQEQLLNCSVERIVSAGQPSTGWAVRGEGVAGENEVVERLDSDQVPVWKITTFLTYKARVGDTVVACIVTARDDQSRQVPFSKEGRITVQPSNVLRAGLETWELVLIILLPLLILLLLLLLLLCYCLGWCCFSQERGKVPASPVHSSASLQQVMPPSRSTRKVRPTPYVETPLPSHRDSTTLPTLESTQPQLNLPWDPYADQRDVPVHYREEGGSSSAGSISSIATSGQEEDLDLGADFEALGPKFAGLASLYAGDDILPKQASALDGGGGVESSRGNPAGVTAKERLHGELIEELNRRSLAEPKSEWRVGPPPPTPSPRPSCPSSSPSLVPMGQTNFDVGPLHHRSTKTPSDLFESKSRSSPNYSPRREEKLREREIRRLSLVLENPLPDESWV